MDRRSLKYLLLLFILLLFIHLSNLRYTVISKDVRRGTSGTSRDLPIFVQFYQKFVQLMKMKEKKKVAKKGRFGRKNMSTSSVIS